MDNHHTFPLFILLADDDVADRFLFKDAIGQIELNIALEMVEGGNDLMNFLLDIRKPIPDFVFLDLNMPYMNGLMCLEEIRKHERLNNLRIIIYSASAQPEHVEKSLNMGANLFFAKSSTFQDLINRLNLVLSMDWEEFSPQSIENFVLTDKAGL